jgi:hypothetical protein
VHIPSSFIFSHAFGPIALGATPPFGGFGGALTLLAMPPCSPATSASDALLGMPGIPRATLFMSATARSAGGASAPAGANAGASGGREGGGGIGAAERGGCVGDIRATHRDKLII